MARVVMVTGVARNLGGRLASRLAETSGVERVIGVDIVPPQDDLGRAEFVRADIRNPVIGKILKRAEVDTVVHMNVLATPKDVGGRTPQKEINVIGTMQLLAACQQAASVGQLVVKSSTTVYGASPRDPALFTEDMEPRLLPRSGYAKDSLEVEGFVRGFSRRRPDVTVTMLRLANIIGPRVRTPMTEYFTLPVVPTVFGHDGRMQFVHEQDALDVLHLATMSAQPGTFNVAGDGVLLLSQAVHLAGRPMLPLPAATAGAFGGILRQFKLLDFSTEQVRFLMFGRAVDTTRMRQVLGFEPTYSTAEAFHSFVRARCGGGLMDPQRLAAVERVLVQALTHAGARDEP